MDFTYFVWQSSEGTAMYTRMSSRIEIATSGTDVYNLMGFKYDKGYDWLVCGISFDGAVNANANSRYWEVSDRHSTGLPWEAEGGVTSFARDASQDWERTDVAGSNLNYTECPFLEKCTFHCSANRFFETGDEKDY